MIGGYDLSRGDDINCVVKPVDSPQNSRGGLWITNWVGAKNIVELRRLKIGAVLTALPTSISKNEEYPKNGISQ